MTDCQVPLGCDEDREEDGKAEADVVEGIRQLRYEVHPDLAVHWPGPFEHYTSRLLTF